MPFDLLRDPVVLAAVLTALVTGVLAFVAKTGYDLLPWNRRAQTRKENHEAQLNIAQTRAFDAAADEHQEGAAVNSIKLINEYGITITRQSTRITELERENELLKHAQRRAEEDAAVSRLAAVRAELEVEHRLEELATTHLPDVEEERL